MSSADSDEEEYEADEAVVSLIACGLTSAPDDLDPQAVTTVNLHGNFIRQLGTSLSSLTKLVTLNLSSNHIEAVEGLGALSQLRTLNLACNKIAKVEGLSGLVALRSLDLSHNLVSDVSGFYELDAESSALAEVRLKDNLISAVRDLLPLRSAGKLSLLELESGHFTNPLCDLPSYHKDVLHLLPQVRVLDPSGSSMRQPRPSGAPQEPAAPSGRPAESPRGDPAATPLVESSSTQTDLESDHVRKLEAEAASLGEQVDLLRGSFQDYDALRSLVQNLRDQQRQQLERQERVLRQEMEIFLQEKDLENEGLRARGDRARASESKLQRELTDARRREQKALGDLRALGSRHAKASEELKELEGFCEQLTGKVEVERALRQRAEGDQQETLRRLNESLSGLASLSGDKSRLQGCLHELERRESALGGEVEDLRRSLQAQCRMREDKERQNAELRKKMQRLNEEVERHAEALERGRRERDGMREELGEEFGRRAAMAAREEARRIKDSLFDWFDGMERSCDELKRRVHGSLSSNEERVNRLFLLRSKLESCVLGAAKGTATARRERSEAERLLEDLAKVSEGLQGQLAHSHAEQQALRKLCSQQGKQIEKHAPFARRYHKLKQQHDQLEKKHEEEQLRSHDLERQCQELRLKTARAAQEAENSKIVSREELQRAEATLKQALAQEGKLQHLQDEINTLGQVIKLKDTLLDDRNKSIEELGRAVKREQEDKTLIVESHSHALEQMKSTMDSLNDELALQDQLVLRHKSEQERLDGERRRAEERAREKDDMLKYVRGEIEAVKSGFELRETKLRAAREEAERRCDDERKERERCAKELGEAKAAVEGLIGRLKGREEDLARAEGQLKLSKDQVDQVEGEMRQLLKVLETERQASQLKVKRVQSALKELAAT